MKKILMLVQIFFLSVSVCGCAAENTSSAEPEEQEVIETEPTPDPQEVEDCLNGMTVREKLAQTMMIDMRTWNDENVTVCNDEISEMMDTYDFGGVILFAPNLEETDAIAQLTADLQAASVKDGGIGILIATDQEGGSVYRLKTGTALPGNMAIGAGGKTENAVKAGEIIGDELQAVGINTALCPVVDVNSSANNPVIGLRSYGDDPQQVGQYGAACLTGLQETGTIACAKHFPGHGDTSVDSHYGLPIVDRSYDELKERELVPFQKMIDAGVDMIMTAHILYPQVDDSTIYSELTGQEESRPATMSRVILTDILKGDMGFEGIVVTDAMNMAGITSAYEEKQAVLEALKAGADMICMPASGIACTDDLYRMDEMLDYLEKAVEEDDLSMERLDDAVRRILTVKQKYGFFSSDEKETVSTETVGSPEHRAAEMDIAVDAVTLIRNDDNVLPLKAESGTHVLIVCPFDNEQGPLGIAWDRCVEQGAVPEDSEVIIYSMLETDAVPSWELQSDMDWADIVIVLSEAKSLAHMGYSGWLTAVPLAVTQYCAALGKTSIVISADKPYDVQLYPDADAVIAVYGSNKADIDVTEVLLEKTTEIPEAYAPNITAGLETIFGLHEPQGTLPVDIPLFDSSLGMYTDEIVYDRGYGLHYGD